MQGKIKFYKQQEGYGFICDFNNKEYYFNIHDIIGADAPNVGDLVEFESTKAKKAIKQLKYKLNKKKNHKTIAKNVQIAINLWCLDL